MTSDSWDTLAAWWDQRQGERGDYWHRTLIDPIIFRLAGSVNGCVVADIACGNGYLARQFARLGAHVIGIDSSPTFIELARLRAKQEELDVEFVVGDAADLNMTPSNSVDVAVCNMGLMNIADCGQAIKEVARILNPGGRFIASLCHPCFNIPDGSAWTIDQIGLSKTIWRKVSRYREPFVTMAPWKIDEDTTVVLPAYHRPLSWYFAAFGDAGLVLRAFEEPEVNDEFVEAAAQSTWDASWLEQIPMHCILELQRRESGE